MRYNFRYPLVFQISRPLEIEKTFLPTVQRALHIVYRELLLCSELLSFDTESTGFLVHYCLNFALNCKNFILFSRFFHCQFFFTVAKPRNLLAKQLFFPPVRWQIFVLANPTEFHFLKKDKSFHPYMKFLIPLLNFPYFVPYSVKFKPFGFWNADLFVTTHLSFTPPWKGVQSGIFVEDIDLLRKCTRFQVSDLSLDYLRVK